MTQLQALQASTFLGEIAPSRWREYPRYLKALQLRLERLPNSLNRDSLATNDLQRRWRDYLQKSADLTARSLPTVQLDEYRWLLEEYRISLFAQPMKTAVPVSVERLNRLWAQL
jgi:ATP-dependent helicase HrpA